MSLFGKRLKDVSAEDIMGLVERRVKEGKTIDFKQQLPATDRTSKKNFLIDVSSFANASGGFLVYGIKEDQGEASDIRGLEGINPDREKLRLQELICSGIEPVIYGFEIESFAMPDGKQVIVVYIPQSFMQPHVVNFDGHWRFHTRLSSGNHPLEIDEVRSAFSLSEALAERIRRFRAERLSKIVSDDTPIDVRQGSKFVFHAVPAGAFHSGQRIDLSKIAENWVVLLKPIHGTGNLNCRYNFDGFLTWAFQKTFTNNVMSLANFSYLQVFNNGCVEAVVSIKKDLDSRPSIDLKWLRNTVKASAEKLVSIVKTCGQNPPFFIMLSLIGVKGYKFSTNARYALQDPSPIDRDALIIPEVMLKSLDDDLASVVKPVFDALWNASGWPCQDNYEDDAAV